MKSIYETLVNGNKTQARQMLYELPLPMYPEMIAFCGENSHFAEWVSANLREILEDTTLVVKPCGDSDQSKQVEKAREALEKEKLVNAAKHLQENAKSKPNRLVRRSVKLAGLMLYKQGLSGLDKVIEVCNWGLENE